MDFLAPVQMGFLGTIAKSTSMSVRLNHVRMELCKLYYYFLIFNFNSFLKTNLCLSQFQIVQIVNWLIKITLNLKAKINNFILLIKKNVCKRLGLLAVRIQSAGHCFPETTSWLFQCWAHSKIHPSNEFQHLVGRLLCPMIT